MKILVGIRGKVADSYFRAVAPFSIMDYVGPHEVTIKVPSTDDVGKDYDVVFLQRICDSVGVMIAQGFKQKGVPFIYDLDDDFWRMPPSWGGVYDSWWARGEGKPQPPLHWLVEILKLADVVTCPAPPLAEKLKEYHNDVRVLPNYVLRGDWDTLIAHRMQTGEGPVVGWFGMPYYWDAWRDAAPYIARGIKAIKGHLVVMGYPEVVNCFPEELAQNTFVSAQENWSSFSEMREYIAGFDLAIIPLNDSLFNWCKSWLKALQFGAAGVPLICSHVVYSQVVEHGKTALVARKPQDFAELIPMAWEDEDARYLMGSQWRATVLTEHTYEKQYIQWQELVESAAR